MVATEIERAFAGLVGLALVLESGYLTWWFWQRRDGQERSVMIFTFAAQAVFFLGLGAILFFKPWPCTPSRQLVDRLITLLMVARFFSVVPMYVFLHAGGQAYGHH